MKTLKVICIELVLALFLTVSAYAGDISTPGVTTSTPIPCPSTEMSGTEATATASDYPTSGVLESADLIQMLVSLMF